MAPFLEQEKILCGSWIASVVTESAQVLEKHQMESPGSLQSQPWASPRPPELPQLCQNTPGKGGSGSTWGAHPSQSVQLSSHVLAVVRCCTEKDQHMNIKSHKALSQTCQTSPARSAGLQHPGTAHPCLPTNSTSWPAGKRGNCEGNRTSSFPVPPCCSQNTKLSHKQLVQPGCATSTCHQKHGHRTGPRVHTQRQSTAQKEQHRPSSHCQNSTARHHHA